MLPAEYFKYKKQGIKSKFVLLIKKLRSKRRASYSNTKTDKEKLYQMTNIASFVFTAMVVGIFLIIIIFAIFSRDLPNPNQLLERTFELSSRFYDKNGELLFEVFGDKNRTLVKLENISPHVSHATLSVEDSEFYLHKGFSIRGMIRAVRNMIIGEGVQGGSTLTQQAIKNTLLTQERTIIRKIKEAILSLQLENRYTKEEILQMYLNESPYGGMNYGVYSAAKAYFNKDPKDLTLAESAYISGLPQSPSRYSAFGSNPEAGIERKNYVLYLMNERGWVASDGKRYYISDEEYEQAKNEVLNFDTAKVPLEAPHFVFYVRQYLAEILGEDAVEMGGLQVKTTLDLETQRIAQKVVTEEVESLKSYNVWNGAMVVIDPKTGGILAMVGSKGYNMDPQPENCVSGTTGENSCKFDPYVNVTTSSRQPGSAIKPITYATFLSQGYTAATPVLDVPTKFEGASAEKPYIPENYDGKFRGIVSTRKCLANSLNIPAVKVLKIIGIDNMIDQAEKMGISTFKDRSRYGLALTLGGGETKLLELTNAFAVFASKGIYRPPTPIIEVTDSKGKVVYKPQSAEKKALGEDVAFIISDILSDDGARADIFGTGGLLNIPGHQVAVKTGTTDDKRDNYTIGFTPSVVAGVWVGNNNNDQMNPYIASGITGATPIWNKFMKEYLAEKENEKFEAPNNVKKIAIDKLTGGQPYKDFDKREEWFIEKTEPTSVSNWYQRIEICKIDGRRANDECRDADETETKDFIRVTPLIPEWQSAVDSWVKENYSDESKYFPPLMTTKLEFDGSEVSNKDDVNVEIVGLSDGDKVSLDFRLNVEVSSYHDVERITIYLDDEKMAEDKSEPYGYNFELDAGKIGRHKFKVTVRDDDGNKGDDEIELEVVGYAVY